MQYETTTYINNEIRKNITNNNKLIKINILNGRYKKHGPFKHYNELINTLPHKIEEVKTIGKFMYWKINNLFIGVGLGLMGGWVFKNNNDKYGRPYPKSDVPVPRTAADSIVIR